MTKDVYQQKKFTGKEIFSQFFTALILWYFGWWHKVLNLLSSFIEFSSQATRRIWNYLLRKDLRFQFRVLLPSCRWKICIRIEFFSRFMIFIFFFQFITLSNVIVCGDRIASFCRFLNFNVISSRIFIKIQIDKKGWFQGKILEIPFCWEIIIFYLSKIWIESHWKMFFITSKNMNKFLFMKFSQKTFFLRKGDETTRRNYLRNFLIGDLKHSEELIVIYRCILWCSKSPFDKNAAEDGESKGKRRKIIKKIYIFMILGQFERLFSHRSTLRINNYSSTLTMNGEKGHKKLYLKFPPWLFENIRFVPIHACVKIALDIRLSLTPSTHFPLSTPLNTFDISLMFDIIKNKRDHIKMPIEY